MKCILLLHNVMTSLFRTSFQKTMICLNGKNLTLSQSLRSFLKNFYPPRITIHIMTSYNLFIGEVDLRSLATKKQMVLNEESINMAYFNIKKENSLVYFITVFLSVLVKWVDEMYVSNYVKPHGIKRHVLREIDQKGRIKKASGSL